MKQKWTKLCSAFLLCCLLVGFFPGRVSAAGFRDVPAGHWAGSSISRCAELGFFQGKTADTFGVGQSMTRSAAVVVLSRFFGWEEAEVSLPYTDVPADAWYAGALQAAYARGTITAQSRMFRPGDPITREELAVMLIRALGYTEIAGMAQELPKTFTDIGSNEGYIAMARDMGLVSGIRTDTFAPRNYATREQVAVILMRLYDKLTAQNGMTVGIVSSAAEVSGLEVVAVDHGEIASTGTVRTKISNSTLKAIRADADEQKATVLLYASGCKFLQKKADAAVENLTKLVEKDGYAGLMLEVTDVTADQRAHLTEFATALKRALGERELWLVLPAPTDGAALSAEAWDYIALDAVSDGMILRVETEIRMADDFPVAPIAPLENVYQGFALLRNSGVDLSETALLLTGEGVRYRGAAERGRLSAAEVAQQRNNGWEYHYSERYGCAWLEKAGGNEAIWYLDSRSVKDHVQMLNLLGAGVCLENVSEELIAAIK